MNFIPCSRHVLLNKCVNLVNLSADQQRQFRSFAEILNAYLHFVTQSKLEQMKQAYAYFNPNQEASIFPWPSSSL